MVVEEFQRWHQLLTDRFSLRSASNSSPSLSRTHRRFLILFSYLFLLNFQYWIFPIWVQTQSYIESSNINLNQYSNILWSIRLIINWRTEKVGLLIGFDSFFETYSINDKIILIRVTCIIILDEDYHCQLSAFN